MAADKTKQIEQAFPGKKTPLEKKAVALKYDGSNAPYISAKGDDDLAREIMEIAEAFSVPMFQQSDLADLLYQLDLNEEIPEALYVAVAEIISFAYMLAGKTPDGFSKDSI